jgi:hypothetical protein
LPDGEHTSHRVRPSSISAARRRPWPPCKATTCLQTEQRSNFASMRSPLIDIQSSPIDAPLATQRCLVAGASGAEARNRFYIKNRLITRGRTCYVCTNQGGDVPPPPPLCELTRADYPIGAVTSMGADYVSLRTRQIITFANAPRRSLLQNRFTFPQDEPAIPPDEPKRHPRPGPPRSRAGPPVEWMVAACRFR